MGEENPGHIGMQQILPLEDVPDDRRLRTRDDGVTKNSSKDASPYDFHVRSATPDQQIPGGSPYTLPGDAGSHYPAGREPPTGALNMSNLASSLPSYQSRGPSQMSHEESQRYQGMAQLTPQQLQSHTGVATGNYALSSSQFVHSFNEPSQSQFYGHLQRSYSGGAGPIHSTFTTGSFPQNLHQQYMFYPGQTSPMTAPTPYSQTVAHYNHEVANRMLHSGMHAGAAQSGQFLRPSPPNAPSRGSSNSSTTSIPSTPRGPPRKPKQSGHALWVGNLPAGTAVEDLKDHFSRDARNDIESVFLISKSSCAFVNYRSDTACAAAMHRFHDSRFQGVRLVCRLRRGPNPTSSAGTTSVLGAPPGPSALVSDVITSQSAPEAIAQNRQISSRVLEEAASEARRKGVKPDKLLEKFFIMKSLTVEDMELSVRNKTWATQAHNEDALNRAYESAENVYLIFSANKSGEYFGYARMASPITEEVSANLEWAPRGETVVDDPDIPRSIPTAATDYAPKGRIIDDSARGTIFWEADQGTDAGSELRSCEHNKRTTDSQPSEDLVGMVDGVSSSSAQSFGKPFKIEWMSTERLPFYRTRGLRNPWNANREVKIARDGTELEPTVGRRLIAMFHTSVDPRMVLPPYPIAR